MKKMKKNRHGSGTMKKIEKKKISISNDLIFEAIQKSLIDDMNKAYRVFKDSIDLKGLVMRLNTTAGFGRYLYDNPEKIQELGKYLAKNLDFPTKLVFTKEGDEELFPLIEE